MHHNYAAGIGHDNGEAAIDKGGSAWDDKP
jgi:hypothetical protein